MRDLMGDEQPLEIFVRLEEFLNGILNKNLVMRRAFDQIKTVILRATSAVSALLSLYFGLVFAWLVQLLIGYFFAVLIDDILYEYLLDLILIFLRFS